MQMYISDYPDRLNTTLHPDPTSGIIPKLLLLNQVSNNEITILATQNDEYPYTNPTENVSNIETILPSGSDIFNIYFAFDGVTDSGNIVPGSFIEIERVVLIQKNNSNNIL
jgi:hypothetical protein